MREKGYYWVKFPPARYPDPEDMDITVGYYNGDSYLPWQVVGLDAIFSDSAFLVIGPRIEPPKGDLWQ